MALMKTYVVFANKTEQQNNGAFNQFAIFV